MSYVTGISGNVISAASAGNAPTNSADVSAIASGYQVVSSTSTQLYAGTAFLTGVNDAPVSASRAGNAANAGMANSAYYDGTGRLISSLPDSAAVSSIASSYAESAASGKLDSSSQVVTSTGSASAMMMGGTSYYASQINGLDISAQKAYVADEWMRAGNKLDATASAKFYTTANESGYVDSAYVDSAVSGKQDTLTFAYDADSAISSINGSALAGGGGGATGDYVEKSAMEVAIGSGNTVSSTAFAQGADNVASGASVAFGVNNTATGSSIAVGDACSSINKALAVGQRCTAWSDALAVGYRDHATNQGLAVGDRCSASVNALALGYYASAYTNAVAAGEFCSAKNTAVAFGKYNLHVDGNTSTGDSAAFVIGDGEYGARHDLMLVTKDGEITMYSSTADTVGTGIMSSIRAISAAATGGGVDSATVSAIASSYVESGVSSKLDTSAQVVTSVESGDYQYEGYWITGVKGVNGNFIAAALRVDGAELASQGDISGVIDTVSSNSATWGQGGVDSATVSAIASSYAESAVSSKLDESATADFYSTSNPSSFVDSSYVDSAVSGKADSSALSSYVPYSGLEYNTASAISGINGSALAAGSTYSAGEGIDITDDVISVETPVDIVAGPGIVIDNPDGNTLRVSHYDPTVDVVRDCENWNGHTMKCIVLRGAYTTNTTMQNQYINDVLPVGTTIAFIDGSNSYVVYGSNPQINMMVPYCIDSNRLFSPWVDIDNRRVNLRFIDVSNSITCTYYLCVKYAVD